MPFAAFKSFFLRNSSWLTTVVFDAASTSTYEAALSTYNWSHTITANANRTLIVNVSIFASGTVTSIDVSGQAMTFVRADTNGVYRNEAWRLFAPASGSVTITVNLSASVTSIANAQSYYNSHQTLLDGNNGANGTNTPATASITTVAPTCTVVGGLATKTASGVVLDPILNERTNSSGALGTGASADFGDVTPAGSQTIDWTGMGVADSWAISLVSLKVPSTVVGRVKAMLTLMGSG